jgi:hypothetical protein
MYLHMSQSMEFLVDLDMSVSIDKSTVHRVVHCMQSYCNNLGAPLVELSWYLFLKYTNFVECVNLASSLLHKSRREIRKNGLGQTNKQTDRQSPEVTN